MNLPFSVVLLLVSILCLMTRKEYQALGQIPPAPQNCEWFFGPDQWIICKPPTTTSWNGDFYIYVHGYTPAIFPAGIIIPAAFKIPEDNAFLWDIYMEQGYGFAAASFPEVGFAIDSGETSTRALIAHLKQLYPAANIRVYGGSMGGVIMNSLCTDPTLSLKGCIYDHAEIAGFYDAIKHWGNVRVVFDYYYPKVLPGTAVTIQQGLGVDIMLGMMQQPNHQYFNAIMAAIMANEEKAHEFAVVAELPEVGLPFPMSVLVPTATVLALHAMIFPDMVTKLGCQMYTNVFYYYEGSVNDNKLNGRIQRYTSTCDPSVTDMFDIDFNKFTCDVGIMISTIDPVIPAAGLVSSLEKHAKLGYTSPYTMYSEQVTTGGHGSSRRAEIEKMIKLLA